MFGDQTNNAVKRPFDTKGELVSLEPNAKKSNVEPADGQTLNSGNQVGTDPGTGDKCVSLNFIVNITR